MIVSYFNEYPELRNDFLYSDQSQMKRVIKQFDDAMIQSGLGRSSDTGQLDTANIPDLDLYGPIDLNKSNSELYRSNGTYAAHKPIIYVFTDPLQATKPVFIKVTFEVGRLKARPGLNLPPAGTQLKYPLILATFVEVGNTTDGNSIISNSINCHHGYLSSVNDNTYNNKYTTLVNYGNRNSIINYQKEKGLLYINLCPSYRVGAVDQTWINGTNNNMNISLMQILVFRVNDDTIGVFGFDNSQTASAGSSPQSRYFRYLNGSTVYNDTQQYSVRGYYNNIQSYVNGKIVTQPLSCYDPVKKTVVRYPYILLSSRSDTGNVTGPNLEVVLSENEKYNYFVYSNLDSGFLFGTENIQNLLIYTGTEKYVY